MKKTKTISMAQLLKEVGLIAEKVNKDYYCANCQLTRSLDGKVSVQFQAYITGYSWYAGETPNEVLLNLNAAVFPPKESPIKDVVIDHDLSL